MSTPCENKHTRLFRLLRRTAEQLLAISCFRRFHYLAILNSRSWALPLWLLSGHTRTKASAPPLYVLALSSAESSDMVRSLFWGTRVITRASVSRLQRTLA